jgi:hypothetical protein
MRQERKAIPARVSQMQPRFMKKTKPLKTKMNNRLLQLKVKAGPLHPETKPGRMATKDVN